MSQRHFVFLRTMPSSFFPRLGKKIEEEGYIVSRINFCLGDWLFWQGPNSYSYREKYKDWPKFILQYIMFNKVTDIILGGEYRNYHKEAIVIAKTQGIRIWVTDFGYLRPDWITLEEGVMGGSLGFPSDPATIIEEASKLPEIDLAPRFRESTWNMIIKELIYNFSNVFFNWLSYPNYRSSGLQEPYHVFVIARAMRILRSHQRNRKSNLILQKIQSKGLGYFLVPMQLEFDYQLLENSPFSGFTEVIEMILGSFSLHSRDTDIILFKSHPSEPYFKKWGEVIPLIAQRFGVQDRVIFLDGGNLEDMIMGANGVVTVNSTSGLKSLQLGCPVKVLGKAIYDVCGLTSQTNLDEFWKTYHVINRNLLDAFVRLLANTVLIRGVLFKEPGITSAINHGLVRLFKTKG